LAKRKKNAEKDDHSGNKGDLVHNPFGALGALSASLPQEIATPKGPASAPQAPSTKRFPNKITVRHESKGRRGKTVTILSGVPNDSQKDLSKALGKALGCGASVKDEGIIVQGNLVDRVIVFLRKAGATNIAKGS
jgi:translation initiation factor 1 (eIF-1/SUI1)